MAAITAAKESTVYIGGREIVRTYGTGAADQADTLTTAAVGKGCAERLIMATCHYSAAPTQAGVTVSIDSGLGATYDTVLLTGAANAQDTVLIPTCDLWILPGDAIVVAAPAAGGVITARITIVTEKG